MKFFIDTANLDKIREAAALGILDGVTTNPTLIAREISDVETQFGGHLKEICRVVDGPVSAEVAATEHKLMVAEAKNLASIASHRTLVGGKIVVGLLIVSVSLISEAIHSSVDPLSPVRII